MCMNYCLTIPKFRHQIQQVHFSREILQNPLKQAWIKVKNQLAQRNDIV